MLIFFLGENLLCFCSCAHGSNSEDGEHAATSSINSCTLRLNQFFIIAPCSAALYCDSHLEDSSLLISILLLAYTGNENKHITFCKERGVSSHFCGSKCQCLWEKTGLAAPYNQTKDLISNNSENDVCVPFFKLPVFQGLFHNIGRVFRLTYILWDVSQSSFCILYILDSKMQWMVSLVCNRLELHNTLALGYSLISK